MGPCQLFEQLGLMREKERKKEREKEDIYHRALPALASGSAPKKKGTNGRNTRILRSYMLFEWLGH